MVPICFEESAWAVVSMLAIVKAGAHLSPLTPANHQYEERTF